MTTVIDERVVEMRFNNADFEKNVAQSMNTLDNLKKALNFDSAKSLEDLGKAANNFKLSGFVETIKEATNQFSIMDVVGVAAIMNITNKALDFGTKFVKSLSVDQVTTGFDKYAVKTQSVQTIMAATADQFTNQAEQMAYVNEQLEKLTWFTDETSYSMTDMTSNIGKFVSNNVPLEEAVTAMEGIATWAGLSGASVNEASRAMYNFSQAMGSGAMKLQDWKSIENANMATAKFKQTALETAVELGTLKKVGDGLYQTLDGKVTASVKDFSGSLKSGWFDTKVMTATLNKFGGFADELNKLYNATDLTTSELLDRLDEFKEGNTDLSDIAADSSMSLSELTEEFQKLTSSEYDLGKSAFAASQEAKTFKEAIDSAKDAVSSGWMTTFELIFGNYLEAKKLWTGLANTLYDMFAEGGNKRNEVLKVWKELGGRDSLILGAVEALNLLIKPLSTIKYAFESILPGGKEFGRTLASMSEKFHQLMVKLQPSEEALNNLYQLFRGIFMVGKSVLSFFGQLIKAVFGITAPFSGIISSILSFLGKVGIVLQKFAFLAEQTNLAGKAIEFLGGILSKVLGVLKSAAMIFAGGVVVAIQTFVTWIQKATTVVSNFVNGAGAKLSSLGSKISSTFSKLTGITKKFSKQNTDLSAKGQKLQRSLAGSSKEMKNFGTVTKDSGFAVAKEATLLNKFLDIFNKAKTVVVTAATVIGGAIVTLGKKIFAFFTDFAARYKTATANAKTITDYIKGIFTTLGGMFSDGWEKVKEFFSQFDIDITNLKTAFDTITSGLDAIITKLGPGRIAAFGFAVAMVSLVGAIIKLSDSFRTMFGSVSGVFNSINKIIKQKFSKSSVIVDLSKAFAILAASLALLTFVDIDDLERVAKVMTKLMVVFTLCALALRGLDLLLSKFNIDTDFNAINSNILALAGAMTLLSVAFAVLNAMELKDDWLKKLGIMAIMFAEVTAAAILISRFAPQLSKGSILLLSLALSMKLMVDALAKIGEKDIDGINKNMAGFALLFAGVAAMTAAAGKIKLTSALSLILVAKALQILIPEISNMVDAIAPYLNEMADAFNNISIDIDKIKANIKAVFDKLNGFFDYLYERFDTTTATVLSVFSIISGTAVAIASLAAVIGVGIGIAKIITAIGSLGNLLKGAGIAAIGLAVALKLVTGSIIELSEYFRKISDVDLQNCLAAFGAIAAIIVGAIGIIALLDALATQISQNRGVLNDGKTLRTNFIGIAAAVVGLGAAIFIIVKAMENLQGIDADRLKPLTISIAAILVALGIAAACAGQIKKGVPVILGLVGVCLAMALLIAEIGILSAMMTPENEAAIKSAVTIVAILLGEIALIVGLAIGLKGGKGALAVLLPVMMMLMSVVAALITVAALGADWPLVAATLGGFAIIIGLLSVLMRTISKSQGLTNAKKLLGVLVVAGLLGAVVGAIAGLAYAIKQNGAAESALALVGLIVMVGVLVTALNVISEMKNSQLKTIGPKLLGLVVIAGSMILVAIAIGNLAKAINDSSIGAGITAVLSLIGAMAAMIKFTDMIIKMKTVTFREVLPKLLVLAAIVGATYVLSLALKTLSAVEIPGRVWSSLGALSLGMVVITALTTVFMGMGKILDWKQALSTIGIVASMCLLLHVLAKNLVLLAGLDPEALKSARENLNLVLLAIGALAGWLGVLQIVLVSVGSGLGSAAGGWAGAVAIPLLILSIATAFITISYALKIGAGAIDILVTALAKLTVVLREIAKLPLEDIVKNLSALPKPLALVGLALLVFGAGAIVGGAGIIVLAYGLEKLNPLLGDFATGMNELSAVDIGSVAKDLLILAIAGAALGSSAGSVATFAVAIGGLATSLSAYQAAKGGSGGTETPKHPLSHLDSFEYIKKEEEAAETHTVQMQKNNAENTRIYESGVLERVDIAQEGSDKIVEIQDEEVAKTNSIFESVGTEGGQKMENSMVESTKKAMDKTADVAEEGSKKVAEKVSSGFERFMGTAETSLPHERMIDSAIDKVGTKATEAMKEVQTAVESEGGVLEALGKVIGEVTGIDIGDGIISGALNGIGTALGLINQFDQTIGQYGGNGMPSYIASMKEYSGLYNKHKASAKEFHVEQLQFDKLLGEDFVLGKDFLNQFTDAVDQGTGALGDFDEAAGKAGKSAKDMAKDLKSTIENQLDIFSKFEIKTGVTGQQMIENMRSNIDGFASWSHRMAVLAQRFAAAGIDKGLYQKLAELGPKGYETMNAFYEMSEEQLAEVKDLYATSLTLPQGQADIVGAGYQYMGEMAVQGFSNALDDHMAAHEAIHGFTKDVIDTAKADLGVQSPSTVFYMIAYNCMLGMYEGTFGGLHWPRDAFSYVINDVLLDMANENLSEENFYSYGKYIVEGLARGLADEEALGKLREGVLTITELINSTVVKEEDMGSPSKLMKKYGSYISEGLAIGIVDAADNVRSATEYVTSVANDAMEYGISNLQNVSDLSTALFLTPIVDLDYLDEQLSGINETIGVNGQNRGNFSATPTESTVNFTQNNYSPKALSRIDIYRQTKNQVSMMKGVVAANA